MTFTDLATLLKLEHSRLLLLDSNDSIKKIATFCGYKNPDYFTQKFHHLYNITPLKFRKDTRKENKTIEQLKSLNLVKGFVELKPILNRKDHISKTEQAQHQAIILVNFLNEPIQYSWISPPGDSSTSEAYGFIQPGERRVAGTAKDQCWQVHDEKDQLIAGFHSINKPGIFIITEDIDLRKG